MNITIFSTYNVTNTTNAINFVQTYAYSLPILVSQGDILAITVSSILFFVALVIVNKLTSFMLLLIKRLMFFFLTGLAFYFFSTTFFEKLALTGPTTTTIIFGVFGILVGILGMVISFYWLFRGAKESYQEVTHFEPTEIKQTKIEKPAGESKDLVSEFRDFKNELSLQITKQDRNLLALLVYVVIAEFGVFSSPTISPPTPQIGIIMLSIFLVAAVFFVRQTYKNLKLGLFHLIAAIIFGSVLSLLLGYFWGSYPLEMLLSLEYFKTSCVVALITGMALSLFMGSK